MKTVEYFSAIKARYGITSDYGLAKKLEVTPQKMSDWMSGRVLPGSLTCYKMAELLGKSPEIVLADIELERAERAHRDGDVKAWRGWVRKLSGATVAGLVAVTFVSTPSPVQAHSDASYSRLYIMLTRRWLIRWVEDTMSAFCSRSLQFA